MQVSIYLLLLYNTKQCVKIITNFVVYKIGVMLTVRWPHVPLPKAFHTTEYYSSREIRMYLAMV